MYSQKLDNMMENIFSGQMFYKSASLTPFGGFLKTNYCVITGWSVC